MSRLNLFALAAAFGLAAASTASAASITLTLNCTFSGAEAAGACGGPTGPFGTVTLSDNATNGNWLDLTVDLSLPTTPPFVLKNLYLNTSLPSDLKIGGFEYEWQGTGISKVEFKTNDLGPSNVPNGSNPPSVAYKYLDIGIEPNSSVDPWTGTLQLHRKSSTDFYDLDPSMLAMISNDPSASPNALVWVAVQYQLNTQPSFTQVAVGAVGDQSLTPVPEPATLLLVGSGIVGWGARRFRARKA